MLRPRPVLPALVAALAGIAGMVAAGCGAMARAVPDTASLAAAATSAAPPISAIASPATLAEPTATAARTSGPQPSTPCEQIAFNIGLHHPGTTQVVVVSTATAAANSGVLQLADLGPQGWRCGPAMSARLGANGTRPLLARRSGDGTTPAGVFPLGRMTAWDGQVFSFFGNLADPGVSAGPFRRVRTGDCFGATPGNADYGHLVQRPATQCPGPDDEYLPRFGSVYERAALIGANMEPNVSGDAPGEPPYAAAIFLHRHSYDAAGNTRPTAGCVSLSHADLIAVLTAMRPGVLFAIGDTPWLLATT
jgi:L,D-peptidoglycan transpeptidase YkuD (ErfK/YbiS/YcfS/YnhG family)